MDRFVVSTVSIDNYPHTTGDLLCLTSRDNNVNQIIFKIKTMFFEQTWRWYGPGDPISLSHIRQTGATGIVTALHHIATGGIWTEEEINDRKKMIEKTGLQWSVVESVPIHETIKTRSNGFEIYLEHYKQSIQNLGACGISTICYNFMPVLDWTRTDLNYRIGDGSTGLRYDHTALAAFDLFILERRDAKEDYTSSEIEAAATYFGRLKEKEISYLTETIIAGLPGAEEHYTLEQFKDALDAYRTIDEQTYRSNLELFLNEIIPVAEKAGVRMAIHPDDPPFSILGLPRIVSTESDIRQLLDMADSPSNGITFCTGSLGARADNDLPGMIRRLGHRIHFLHLRNVQHQAQRSFFEAHHLEGSVDLHAVMLALIREQHRRHSEGRTDLSIPMRPDHGHKMIDDVHKKTNPGYSCIGRLKGLAELRGLETGIRKTLSLKNLK